jgi:hypothetical protein
MGTDQALDAEGRTQARHWPDRRNRLLVTRRSGAGGENAATAVNRYDAAGNLVFDGDYFYQYDAWNESTARVWDARVRGMTGGNDSSLRTPTRALDRVGSMCLRLPIG